MSSMWSKIGALALLSMGAGCVSAGSRDRSQPAPPAVAPSVRVEVAPTASASPLADPTPSRPTLLITDPRVLRELEEHGLTPEALFGAEPGARGNGVLSRLELFAPLVDELRLETKRAARADPMAGVDVARFSHRLFDVRFLSLPEAHFALAGIVNRPDRAAFDSSSCGETRLIYRLAYALDAERASKLPMTLGIEFKVPRPPSGCREAAARWLDPATVDPLARAAWLRSARGPLAPALLQLQNATARVVVNVQLVRWPATVRPDLGGHAEYLLRSFRPGVNDRLEPERLENTIDPSDFLAAGRQQALVNAIAEDRARIDAGTPLLPAALLTSRALSVTPRGLHRLSNRPFSAALPARLLATQEFSGSRFVKSNVGLLRRLDQLSCPGCHQARSIAGFHLLGEGAADAPPENALAIAVSPHVTADLPRRLRIAEQMLSGEDPDYSAPLAERPSSDGGYGQACALLPDPSFAGWDCAAGLHCSSIEANVGDPIGQCLPAELQVGDACERGGVAQDRHRLRDRMRRVNVESCPQMICNRSGVGFPGGMCTAPCNDPAARCGAIAILDPFNACLARGDSFLSCIRGNVQPAGLRACDAQNPCRDDYVCARTAQGGACLPPYFVFQLRVDGHSSGLL